MKLKQNKMELLIYIILYLLLAIAFFRSDNFDFRVGLVFLFGFLSIFFLYIGLSFNNYFRAFGYAFTLSFVLMLAWFIFNVLAIGQGDTTIERILNLLSIKHSKAIWIGLLIPILLGLWLIIKKIIEIIK